MKFKKPAMSAGISFVHTHCVVVLLCCLHSILDGAGDGAKKNNKNINNKPKDHRKILGLNLAQGVTKGVN